MTQTPFKPHASPSSAQSSVQSTAPYCCVPYEYRDGSNFKQVDSIYLLGPLTPSDLRAIRAILQNGEFFIPGDLGLDIEELQPRMSAFPADDDHVWHSLELGSAHPAVSLPEGVRPVEVTRFVAAFTKVGSPRGWQVARAMERLGVYA